MKKLFILILPCIILLQSCDGPVETNPEEKMHHQWVNVNEIRFKSFAGSGNTIYGGGYGGVYVSINFGLNWTFKNNGMPTGQYTITMLLKNNLIYAGTKGTGILYSSNNGDNWNQHNEGLSIPGKFTDTYSLILIGKTIISANGELGVFYLSEEYENWKPVNDGFTQTKNIVSIINHNGKMFAVDKNSGSVYSFGNTDSIWTSGTIGLSGAVITSIAGIDNYLIVGTAKHGIFRSSNDGLSWNNSALSFSDSSLVSSLMVHEDKIFAAANSRIYLSTDKGFEWTTYTTGLPEGSNINCIFVYGNTIFAATESGLYRRYYQ